MKGVPLWLTVAGVAAVGLVLALRAQENHAAKPLHAATTPGTTATPSGAPKAAVPPAAQPGEKIVYSFTDDAQVRAFAQVWQQRQISVTKMAVLQTYWKGEQDRISKLNDELQSKFNLEHTKSYAFDPKRKVILERGQAQPWPTEIGQRPAAAGAPASAQPSAAQ